MSLENEIGDKPLTFILILKKLWGRWVEPWDLLLPSTFSSSNLLLPPSYSCHSFSSLALRILIGTKLDFFFLTCYSVQ